MGTPESQPGRKAPSKLWVPFVIVVGVLLGITISFAIPAPFERYEFAPFVLDPVFILHVVLSTVSITLLVALLVVYLGVYSKTQANFALGINIVLAALLAESLLEYPIFLGLISRFPVGHGPFLDSADIFTIIAFTVFLYLSLE
ncbi:MAG TPA: hypothetical protein VEC02_07200 [Nitrososphaerales archaeon]|nr:hypothetical protein [Nitrososphaerales archaeon]